MRRKDREIKNFEEIEEILKNSSVLRLGLLDDNKPYIVPMNYCYLDKVIYLHSAKRGKKIDILIKNNYVCFEIDISGNLIIESKCDKCTMLYKSVIGYGTVEFVEEIEEKKYAIKLLMSHYREPNFSYNESLLNNVLIIKLKINTITGKKNV